MTEIRPQPCNMCGRTILSYFDHVDVGCLNWPERDATLPHTYRGYEVDHHMYMGYQYVHEDYDGPEDNRAGTEMTLELCYRAIDEREDDD